MEKLVLFLLLGVLSTVWPLLHAQQLTTDPPAEGLVLLSTRSAVTATTGDPKVVLSCTLAGPTADVNAFCADSESVLQWKVNGTRVDLTQYGSEFLVEGNCTHTYLTFLQVYPVLEGRYTCELSNNATVKARILVTIRPAIPSGYAALHNQGEWLASETNPPLGCNPDIFRGSAAVGQSVTSPCGGIHPAFNSLGRVRWTCVDHLTWTGDLTNCTIVPSYDKSILLFLYRVTVAPGSTVGSLLAVPDPLTHDFLNNVLPMLFGGEPEGMMNANGMLADVRASERWMTELLVLFAVEPQGPIDHNGILQAAQEPVMLAGENASPLYAGNPMFVPADTCTCPKLWSDFSGELLEMVPVTVSFCRAPNYVDSPCSCQDGCQCTGVFQDIGIMAVNCTLDTDGDLIPNQMFVNLSSDQWFVCYHGSLCEGCCLGEVNGGYAWMDSPIQLTSLVSCASIHSSFNAKSYADRRCTADPAGVWAAVSVSGCAFMTGSDTTIVVLEADVDLGYVQELQQTVEEAVTNEINVQFSSYGLLNADNLVTTVSGQSHVVAILEFPKDVSQDVVLVYHSPQKRATAEQREKRGAISLLFRSSPVVYGHRPTDTCPCSPTQTSLSGRLFDTCIGPPGKLCNCAGTDCSCVDPYARTSASTNTTMICGVDSDGDGIPDVDDDCPQMYSPDGGCIQNLFNEGDITCESEADPVWGILWSQTAGGSTDTQRCPGGVTDAKGLASRFCGRDGQWAKPNVMACESYQFATVRSTSMEVEASLTQSPAYTARTSTFRIDVSPGSVNVLEDNARTLMGSTEPGAKPILPMDLDATLLYLEVISSLSEITTLFADGDFDENMMFTIIDNILESSNQEQWELLNESEDDRDANLMLELVERISKTYSFNLDTHPDAEMEMDDSGVSNMFLSWDGRHIFVSAELISPSTPPRGVPMTGGTMGGAPPQSFDRPDMVPSIVIPNGLLEERAEAMGESRVSVVTVVVSTLADFLPEQAEEDVDANATIASVIIASQVSLLGGDSNSLQDQPVQIQFPIPDSVRTGGAPVTCVFWNFSAPTSGGGSGRMGGWSRSGLDMDDIASGSSDVSCLSSHLTSFAILVDASGVTGVISAEEALAFDIVTYIGCAISLACLILTALFFLFQGRDLYRKAVNFVHLNLSISLICGLVVFVSGIQTATWSKIACGFVAALLHYFFLAAFSWMLCEGVSLYLLLVKVFGANKKKWLLMYTLLGWGTPLPIVAVSVGVRYDYYRIPNSYNISSNLYNQTRACWLPTEYGIIAAFIVPMLVMILINCVFGVLALKSVFKFKKDQVKRSMDGMKEREVAIALMKALVILLPLLGLTWVIGLLAVNPYTTVFAWIFLFLNAFQGVFIFFFHVVRHDKVWSKIVKCVSRCRKVKAAVTEESTSKRSLTVSSGAAFSRTSTTVSILGDSRKTSIVSSDFLSTAHEDDVEKAIPATVIEEEQPQEDDTKF